MATTLISTTPTPDDVEHLKSIIRQSCQMQLEKQVFGADPGEIAAAILRELKQTGLRLDDPLETLWQEKLAEAAKIRIASWAAVEDEEQGDRMIPPSLLLGLDVKTSKEVKIPSGSARAAGAFMVGNTRTGKSTVAVQGARKDILRGSCVFFFDPHWSAIYDLIRVCPEERLSDIILIDPVNMEYPIGINLLARTNSSIDSDMSRLMEFMDRQWGYKSKNPSWGSNMQRVLWYSIYTCLCNSGITLAEFLYLYERSPRFRDKLLENVPQTGEGFNVHRFWEEFNRLPPDTKSQWCNPIKNKIESLLIFHATRLIFSQVQTTIDFEKCMSTGKIVLIHLPEDKLGAAAGFIGTLLLEEIMKAIFRRDPTKSNPFCSIYIDEFPTVSSSLFVSALPQVGKFNIGFFLSCQYLQQLNDVEGLTGAVKQLPHQATMKVAYEDAVSRAPLYAQTPPDEEVEKEEEAPPPHVLNYYLFGAGKPHPNPKVVAFVEGWKDVDTALRESLDSMEEYLYAAISEKNARRVLPQALFNWMMVQFGVVLFSFRLSSSWLNSHLGQLPHADENLPLHLKYRPFLLFPGLKDCNLLVWAVRPKEEYIIAPPQDALVYENLWTTDNLEEAIEALEQYIRGHLESVFKIALNRIIANLESMKLTFVKDEKEAEREFVSRLGHTALNDSSYWPYKGAEILSPDTVLQGLGATLHPEFEIVESRTYSNDYRPARLLTEEVSRAMEQIVKTEVENCIADWKPVFTEYVSELRSVIQALVDNPPTVRTGHKIKVMEPSRKKLHDVREEVSIEISTLPNHVAYVRVGAGDTSFSAKIQTLPLPDGVDDKELKARLELIREQTKQYGKSEEDIEAELEARRVKWGIIVPDPAQKPQSEDTTAGGEEHKPQAKKQEQTEVEEKKEAAETESPPVKEAPKQEPSIPALRVNLTRSSAVVSDTLPTNTHPIASNWDKTTGDTYAQILYYLSYASLDQLVRVTGKQSSKNNERAKIAKLVKDGLVATEQDRETSSKGRARSVYSLTLRGYRHIEETVGLPVRRKGNLASDTLLVNDVLISAVLAAKQDETIDLLVFHDEKTFEQAQLALPGRIGVSPDGVTIFKTNGNIYPIWWECDSGSETKVCQRQPPFGSSWFLVSR